MNKRRNGREKYRQQPADCTNSGMRREARRRLLTQKQSLFTHNPLHHCTSLHS
jgi:hypothetical protein